MADADQPQPPAAGVTPEDAFALGYLAASLRGEGRHADADLIRRVLASAVGERPV